MNKLIQVDTGVALLSRNAPDGLIVSARVSAREVKLGQKVYSNGRVTVPKGIMGIVISIVEPYNNGRTDNIFNVFFEGEHNSYAMKIQDFLFD